jgi:hypothetical protein
MTIASVWIKADVMDRDKMSFCTSETLLGLLPPELYDGSLKMFVRYNEHDAPRHTRTASDSRRPTRRIAQYDINLYTHP